MSASFEENPARHDSGNIDELERIFSLIADAPEENRDGLLKKHCSDEVIRLQVEALLDADSSDNQILDRTLFPKPEPYKSGERIGRYKLIDEIGEGGMGAVYLAEQLEPVRRNVALKIIRPDANTRHVIKMFENERQTLSMMEHPNIAKVLDAGATEDDRPYIAMELVNGKPITEYCDQQKLSIRERLELFLPVCYAIQHAHQKGIIHRDIKPSNVLVAEFDGQPVAKVIDFGVAKAIEQPFNELKRLTAFGEIVGTFEYMSPEQSFSGQLDIDTRSDIYSLGVLLYELLTSTAPFDTKLLRTAPWDEMLKIIRESEPPRPSTRIAELANQREARSPGKSEFERRSKTVRGELDWMVMKAIEKDRERRYDTPNELASDVECYLQGRAVAACPPSPLYRFKTFVRRNKVAFTTSAIVAAALVVGTVVASWQAIRAFRAEEIAMNKVVDARAAAEAEYQAKRAEMLQRKKAQAAEEIAVREAAVSKAVNDFIRDDLLGLVGAEGQILANLVPDPEIKLVTVLERALERVDVRFNEQPLAKNQIKATLAVSFRSIGQYKLAARLWKDVLDFHLQHEGERALKTLVATNRLANCYLQQGLLVDAETLLEGKAEVSRNEFGSNHDQTQALLSTQANLYQKQGRFLESERVYSECLEVQLKLNGEATQTSAGLMSNLALVSYKLKAIEKAENLHKKALEIRRKILPKRHPDIAESLNNLGTLYFRIGFASGDQQQLAKAVPLLDEAFISFKQTRGLDHPTTLEIQHNIAQLRMVQRKFSIALPLFYDLLARRLRVLEPNHANVFRTRYHLGCIYNQTFRFPEAKELFIQAIRDFGDNEPTLPEQNALKRELAIAYRRTGEPAKALAIQEELLLELKAKMGADHPQVVSESLDLGASLISIGRTKEGQSMLEQALTTPNGDSTGRKAYYCAMLADSCFQSKQFEKAILWSIRQAECARKEFHSSPTVLATALASSGVRLSRMRSWSEAEKVFADALEQSRKGTAVNFITFDIQSMLGSTLAAQEKFALAKGHLLEGYEGLVEHQKKIPANSRQRLIKAAILRVIDFYVATEDEKEIERWKKLLEEKSNL